ncbi:16S rRNA (guanine(527)-N(7))-methyltransferase RsmG [Simiduia curdlanivorans]|uniref:Ribosomal RNA small subunit methyltransferase G n=1 Tax=Simiduia curdlanivorans TaxID=1492769 RepID=A0ABV8UZW9_9GAMM|nr:16S rRNA (guanine(527)-N(7))-methyltransferase RsmG [Simiduia curdlanivorans]MDN3637994.1 16S rRNA (guanine(527)-N(7))-methyltransferase RsmG [Simiduia curdlanivorans]
MDSSVLFSDQLERGLAKIHLSATVFQQQQLVRYLVLFEKWNKAYNLSAIRDREEMVSRHLLDSLVVQPFVKGDRIIDVGTGGGLPGIPLAIMNPEKHYTLLDSNGKKTRFLFQVKTELALGNVQIANTRVENFKPTPLFDGVISRAFASIEDMIKGCEPLLSDNGRFWAMKGVYPETELSVLAKHYTVEASHSLDVPGCDGERHLLEISRARRPV